MHFISDSFNCSINSPLQRSGVPTPPGSRTDSSPLSRCSSSGPIQSPIQGKNIMHSRYVITFYTNKDL